MPRKSYVLHFIGFFHSWTSQQKLPFQSYGVIYLPYAYGDSYRAIATTHGSSFDGISFACCLMLKAITTILRLKISIHTVFGLDRLGFIIALFNVCFFSVDNFCFVLPLVSI